MYMVEEQNPNILIQLIKSTRHYATFRATVCSNRWREPIKCFVVCIYNFNWLPLPVTVVYCVFWLKHFSITFDKLYIIKHFQTCKNIRSTNEYLGHHFEI